VNYFSFFFLQCDAGLGLDCVGSKPVILLLNNFTAQLPTSFHRQGFCLSTLA